MDFLFCPTIFKLDHVLIQVHLLVFKDKYVLDISAVFRMKVIAAYLLAVLGGNTSPTADDVKSILESGISAILVVSDTS